MLIRQKAKWNAPKVLLRILLLHKFASDVEERVELAWKIMETLKAFSETISTVKFPGGKSIEWIFFIKVRYNFFLNINFQEQGVSSKYFYQMFGHSIDMRFRIVNGPLKWGEIVIQCLKRS